MKEIRVKLSQEEHTLVNKACDRVVLKKTAWAKSLILREAKRIVKNGKA